MIYLVAYDIANDRTRKQVSDLLLAHGFERLQLSLFLGHKHPARMPSLWPRLQQLLQRHTPAGDRLVALPITLGQLQRLRIIGQLPVDLDLLTGKKKVLIL